MINSVTQQTVLTYNGISGSLSTGQSPSKLNDISPASESSSGSVSISSNGYSALKNDTIAHLQTSPDNSDFSVITDRIKNDPDFANEIKSSQSSRIVRSRPIE